MRHFTTCCLISLAMLPPVSPVAPAVARSDARSSITKDASTSCSAASPVASPAAYSPKDWKIGIQLWTFHFVSFARAIEKADSAGVRYLEAFPRQPLGFDVPDTFGIRMSEASK
ncbi:MAG TPA: hypothetical protein VMH27_01950, partial [Puia sp.]|nr:hypothetical protein [Puia sp.]